MQRLWTGLGLILLLISLPACSLRLEQAAKASGARGALSARPDRAGDTMFRATPEEPTRREPVAAQREEWWGDTLRVAPIQ